MRLQFLGTGGFHPCEPRHTSCILLPDLGIVLDAGTGSFRVKERLTVDDVQLFLTHAHLDHVMGLPSFLVPLLFNRIKRMRVYGNTKTLLAVREHIFAELIFPVLPSFDFIPFAGEVELPAGGKLTYHPLVHPGGSLGFRLDWPDRSLAYITDTTVDGSYTEFIRGADLLIHECNFSDAESEWAFKTGHSYTSQVATLAKEAEVGRLYMTHLEPRDPRPDPIDLPVARAIFPESHLAADLLEIDF